MSKTEWDRAPEITFNNNNNQITNEHLYYMEYLIEL